MTRTKLSDKTVNVDKKIFTDFPPEAARADKPVVKEPSRTCIPIAAFNVYPVHLAFAEYLSFSMIAISRVGFRRSPTVRLLASLESLVFF